MLNELLRKLPPSAWLVEMRSHYEKTGQVRPQDLERILGDQTIGISMESRKSSKFMPIIHTG